MLIIAVLFLYLVFYYMTYEGAIDLERLDVILFWFSLSFLFWMSQYALQIKMLNPFGIIWTHVRLWKIFVVWRWKVRFGTCLVSPIWMSRITDPNERLSKEVQIMEFGQTPKQLFRSPHPQRFQRQQNPDPVLSSGPQRKCSNSTGKHPSTGRKANTLLWM